MKGHRVGGAVVLKRRRAVFVSGAATIGFARRRKRLIDEERACVHACVRTYVRACAAYATIKPVAAPRNAHARATVEEEEARSRYVVLSMSMNECVRVPCESGARK